MASRRLAADWVFPGVAPPIKDGALLIGADGDVVALGPDVGGDVPSPPGVPTEYFPDAAILPGLVNAHTHLELTGLGPAIDEPDFPSWIRRLRALKAERTPEQFLEAAKQGVRECWAAGVTTIADTGDTGSVARALAELGGRGVAYHEVFGPHPAQVADSMAGLKAAVAELRTLEVPGRLRIGVSPHAPYTVSGSLYHEVGRWAREEKLPLAVHLAESAEESSLLRDGTGGFADAWAHRGIPAPEPLGLSPVAFVDRHLGLMDTLCIHAVQVDLADIALLFRRGATVAHCPMSNRAHRHGDAPLAAILDAKVHVGVGTDSVLSVGRMDLLAEARAARALANLSAFDTLGLVTWYAAGAIGFWERLGMLVVGSPADIAVVRISAGTPQPEEDVLSGRGEVIATFVGGREVYRRGRA
jgi:cytosine/adenosine deaminase-related metal-dependent hydrolase